MKLVPLFATFALILTPGAGCSNKAPEERKEAVTLSEEPRLVEPAPVAPTAAPTPTVNAPAGGIPSDFPKDCVDYATLIDKLKACDQIGGARDSFTQAYENVRTAWSMVPDDRRKEVATQCKTQADSLRNAAAATCAW